jgi:hypothetical protein
VRLALRLQVRCLLVSRYDFLVVLCRGERFALSKAAFGAVQGRGHAEG